VTFLLALLLLASLALRLWSASDRLDNSRHFDERFTLRNVSAILVNGDWKPVNAFYGALSYLPQTAALALTEGLHRATGAEVFAVFDQTTADGWSKTAYAVARGTSALFGVLGIWAVFLLGRRLFDPWVGLLAAALVAALPAHIVSSALIKPDILVALLVTVTFLWILSAVDEPTPRRFAWAGVGIGLAVSAKYTGVGVAIPLVVGALLMPAPLLMPGPGQALQAGWGRWRRLWLLTVAALASLVTFLILHPHIALVFEYLPRLWNIMETKGEATGGSHWSVFALEARYLLRHHRWPVLLLAVAGTVAIVARALRRPPSEPGERPAAARQRLQAWMVLSYLFGYSVLYAAATKLFKGQNYLPVTAFTALLAGWAAVAGWRWLARRWRPLTWAAVAVPVWALALAALFQYPLSTTYHQVVPSTWVLVERLLEQRLQPAAIRYLYFERRDQPLRLARDGHLLVSIPVESLTEVPAQELDAADAELFLAADFEGPSADFYFRRAARPGYRSERFDPGWFAAHGPPLVVLLHGWRQVGEGQELALLPSATGGGHRFDVALEHGVRAGETVSFQIVMPISRKARRPAEVRVNGMPLPLYETKSTAQKAHELTSRVTFQGAAPRLLFSFEERLELPWTPQVTLHRWQR
jgi:hypothetical protein